MKIPVMAPDAIANGRAAIMWKPELAEWKRHASKWLRGYVLLKRLADARQSEMLALRLSNLSSQEIHFWISKTHREKIVRWF
jgi:hypothetical protein